MSVHISLVNIGHVWRFSLEGCALSELTLRDPCKHTDALVADFADCTKLVAGLPRKSPQAASTGPLGEFGIGKATKRWQGTAGEHRQGLRGGPDS